MADIHPAVKKLQEKFPGSAFEVKTFREEVTITVPRKEIVEICRFLYADPDLQYQFLTDLCGLDFFPETPRFEVVYLLTSIKRNQRLRLKTKIKKNKSISSVESI